MIGPGESTDTTSSTTYLGLKSGENPDSIPTPTAERRIVLTPSIDPDETATDQVGVYNNGGTTNDLPSTTTTIKKPTAVVINSPRRLSISEPKDGYTLSGVADVPLDYDPSTAISDAIIKAAIWNDGRTDRIAALHLQRLANPLLPYNALSNPYRTVDSMPIDLTSFNGLTNTTTSPEKVNGAVISSTHHGEFFARQRGANTTGNDLWTQEPLATVSSPKINTVNMPPAVSGFNFNAALYHTLSYLNDPFGAPNTTTGAIGDPSTTPFPWLTWNNRPFVSQLELLLVPWAKSSQLCRDFNLTAAADPYTDVKTPFPRFLSFLQSAATATSGTAAQLYRILEFVGVPSRFVGTDIQINPSAPFAGTIFYPPFNRIQTGREPGKVNLNTVSSKNVYDTLMGDYLNATNPFTTFQQSRQGVATNPLNGDYPTRFIRPFRSFGGANLVPPLVDPAKKWDLKPAHEIDATLLRPNPITPTQPLFNSTATSVCNDPTRNPYFYYQGLERLGNLVTTRSNVYAVWITVGYFEVSPWPTGGLPTPGAAHPDGYQLGRELGSDTGEIERHRAFYIFDRTLPVGFQRGQDLNVEKAILVDRYIE